MSCRWRPAPARSPAGPVASVKSSGATRRVHLERRIRPFGRDVLADQVQGLGSGNPDAERAPVQPPQAPIQCPVAGRVGHHAQVQVVRAEGGQDADQRDPAVLRPDRVLLGPGQRAELAGQRGANGRPASSTGEAFSSRLYRLKLERDPRVGGQVADGLVPRQRKACVVDQAGLQLGADRDRADPEAGPGEQLSEVGQAPLEPLPEPGVVLLAERLPDDLGSHG